MTKDEMKKSRRIVRVSVSDILLKAMCIQGRELHLRCTHGLPEDAELIGDAFDSANFRANLFFYHPTFAQVKDGGMVPEFVIEWTDMQVEEMAAKQELLAKIGM